MSRIFTLLLFLVMALPAQAQLPGMGGDAPADTSVLPDPLTPEAVRAMVSQMSDGEVRSFLLQRLDAVAEEAAKEEGADTTPLDWLESVAAGVSDSISHALHATPLMPGSMADALEQFYAPRGFDGLLVFLGWLIAVLAAGRAAEMLVRRVLRRWSDVPAEGNLKEVILSLSKRFMVDGAGLMAFLLVADAVILTFMPEDTFLKGKPNADQQLAQLVVWVPVFYTRLAFILTRFLLSPKRPSLRLLTATDTDAAFFMRNIMIIAALWGLLAILVIFFLSHGVPIGKIPIGFWPNILLYLWIIGAFWVGRDAVRKVIMGPEPESLTPPEKWVAHWYPAFAIGVTVSNWLLIEYLLSQRRFDLLDGRQNVTLFVLLCAPALDTAIRGLVRHLVKPMQGEGVVAERAYHSTKRSYVRIGRILVFGFIISIVAGLWGIDFKNIAAAGVGAQLAARLVEFLITVAFGYLVWELAALWINRKLAAEQTAAGFDPMEEEPAGGEGGGAGASRLSTVLPLLLGFLKVTIAAIVALIALGNLGIDITPLLAGAGVIGLAVGFGAQKLVADVVSGIFFLIDDAFRTGEYVEVEGTMGTVEKISVRSMQLRHHKGPVHTIPYGEIPKVTNYSRDWVIMKLRFTVPFDTDPQKVKKIFKKIGADIMDVPELAADILQPFKSQGVLDIDDVGMIIRGKFMAKPGKQFTLRKEVYSRVKAAFAENGIEFARREVRVAIPGLDETTRLTEEEKSSIAAAATEAAQTQLDEEAKTPIKK